MTTIKFTYEATIRLGDRDLKGTLTEDLLNEARPQCRKVILRLLKKNYKGVKFEVTE